MTFTIKNMKDLRSRLQKFRQAHPTLSIVIPAYNEEKYLINGLEALSHLMVPPGERVELIVVNNASTDRTQRILDMLEVYSVFEPKKGITYARARGITAARGEIILQTDADSYVPPRWITRSISLLRQNKSVAVTGPIVYEASSTHWLMLLYLSLSRLRRGAGAPQRGGAYMAYKTTYARQVVQKYSSYGDQGEDKRLCFLLEQYGLVEYAASLPPVTTHGRRFGSFARSMRFITDRFVEKFQYKMHLLSSGTELSWYLREVNLKSFR